MDEAVINIAAQIIDETGTDWVSAMDIAEETLIDIFDQTVREVAMQVATDTQIDIDSANYLAKMIMSRAAAEGRQIEDLIAQVEQWAQD